MKAKKKQTRGFKSLTILVSCTYGSIGSVNSISSGARRNLSRGGVCESQKHDY